MRWSRASDRFSPRSPRHSGDSPGIRAGVLPPVCGLRVGGFYKGVVGFTIGATCGATYRRTPRSWHPSNDAYPTHLAHNHLIKPL